VLASERGFTIIELLVAVTIMLVITGAIFAIVDPSRSTARAQPEVTDQNTRMRVGLDTLSKDLVMAGAGTYSGAIAGGLANFFAPIVPFRMGTLYPGEYLDRFHGDRITIAYVPNTAAQTRVRDAMPQPSSEVKVDAQPGCPAGDALCGFREGMRVVIFDDTGAYDFFTVTQVQTDALHLQHRPPVNPDDFSKAYTPAENARIAQVETHTYFRDTGTNQLMHYWGDNNPPEPVTDQIVDLRFEYFGDPEPPTVPRPPPGGTNCLFNGAGVNQLATLPSNGSSLVELTPALLSDGPFCGQAPNQYDADLYRIRRVRVTMRVQTGLRDLRGTDPVLFRNPGVSSGGQRFIPDFEMSYEIAPRNMNLMR
jgi:prepilin-type N-terminal cleavage/methylation domain-containing protein